MLKATWMMMRSLKNQKVEVIQMSKAVWRNLKEDFDFDLDQKELCSIYPIVFFFGRRPQLER